MSALSHHAGGDGHLPARHVCQQGGRRAGEVRRQRHRQHHRQQLRERFPWSGPAMDDRRPVPRVQGHCVRGAGWRSGLQRGHLHHGRPAGHNAADDASLLRSVRQG